jgi:hypothetical protein
VAPIFTLGGGTVTALGDVEIGYGALIAPSNNFRIGGSALNSNGTFDPNNATTTFISDDLGETIDFGEVNFYNLAFDGVGGGWELATTTVDNNFSLVTGASFTQTEDTTLRVDGRFSNSFNAASTTWTNTTLDLRGGDYTVTEKGDSGDDYATVAVSGDTDLIIWNSTISTSSIADTSSIYMPDYDGTDGNLRIFGDYERLSGTEHWSYTIDFDGASITPRPAVVEISRRSTVTIGSGATLSIDGDPSGTTTVSAISGQYALTLDDATLYADTFTFGGADSRGLYLSNGTIISELRDGTFNVFEGNTGITAENTTVNAQPSSVFTGLNFASTTFSESLSEQGWAGQINIAINPVEVGATLSDFPLYVDLSTLGPDFWSSVKDDGGDIRVTETDGYSLLPIELVSISTTTESGELYFRATEIDASSGGTFIIHYGNPAATALAPASEFGSQNVWSNGYTAVYHLKVKDNPVETTWLNIRTVPQTVLMRKTTRWLTAPPVLLGPV